MGIIYKLTAPNGRVYIGQTIKTLAIRWGKHVQKALQNTGKNECRLLNNAIRKYKANSFHKEVLWEGPDDELNEMEEIYICFENAYWEDGGLNLTRGGNHRITHQTEMSKDKMSDARRQLRDYDLPRNVVQLRDAKNNNEGFRVIHNAKTHNFVSMHMTMDEKYSLAMECYDILQNGDQYEHVTKSKQGLDEFVIPKYIVKRGPNGFAVNKPGFTRKTFDYVNTTRFENLQAAMYYLKSLDTHE